ncbi:MAG: phosphotransferase [Solobacterium sp.]|nr:phosphotransferase [Solobacterium sp.]
MAKIIYGIVFELLEAKSSADYIRESPEHFESFLKQSVELMKSIHAITAEPGDLPDMKQKTLSWLPKVHKLLPENLCSKLDDFVNTIPDTKTIIHADFHMKNVLLCGEELMLIDMDTLSTGDPIFELATVFVSYRQFPSIEPKAAYMLGIDVETAARICDRIFELYLDDADEETLRDTKNTAQLLGCIRIIDYLDRHPELPDGKKCIDRCVQDITKLLQSRE